MKWKARTYIAQTIATNYDLNFAWLPKRTLDGKWVWLERFIVRQEFLRVNDEDALYPEWVVTGRWSQEFKFPGITSPQSSETTNEPKTTNESKIAEKLANVISLKDWASSKNKNNLI